MDSRTVGVLGGGQLGRMMVEAGNRLGIRIAVLDPQGPSSPAGQLSGLSLQGSFQDSDKVKELASISDVITTEIEHVNVDALESLELEGRTVHPNSRTLRIIQDKYLQKAHLLDFNIPLPLFQATPTVDSAIEVGRSFGYPFMLKNRKLAYDGRGNAAVKSENEIMTMFENLGGHDIYAEKWVPYVKELAVMVVRTKDAVHSYPVVETVQENNICHLVTAPAQVSQSALQEASRVASEAIATFDGIGIFGVELFLLPDDSILLNEIAPRPHNSGHYTIEACEIDQFEMHLRAVLGLPCPIPRLRVGVAMMINILGTSDQAEEIKTLMHKALAIPGAGLHWYGKAETRKGRKMAHITFTGNNFEELRERVESFGLTKQEHGLHSNSPKVGIIMGSDSDLPIMQQAAQILDQFNVTYELTIVSAHRTPTRMFTYAQSAADRGVEVIIAGAGGAAHLPGMTAALTSLPVIGVPIKSSALSGNDSLLSIVQMPKGIPVATVAIDNAANAGLLAVRILAAQDKGLLTKMDKFMVDQEEEVLKKARKLEDFGYQEYLRK
jgi:phosphoribosylaminoimidazole carboxylase